MGRYMCVCARARARARVCVCVRERERELRTQLYYSRIEILGSSIFLQSVLAKVHRQHI